MIITNYNDIDVQQWQRLVETSPTATWFQTPEAYRFFASLPEMMTPFVFAVTAQPHSELVSKSPIIQDETAAWEPTADVTQDAVINNDSHSNPFHLKGIVVGYITREKSHVKQFFTRRAIIYGGPLLAEDIAEEELKSLLFALCSHLNKKAIYIETRNFNDFSRWRPVFEQCGFRYQPHYDMHISIANEAEMWARLHESKQRQVKRALQEWTFYIETKNNNDIREFYELLANLYKTKVHRPLPDLRFFEKFVENGYGVMLVVKQNHRIVGGILCPVLRDKIMYEWYVVGDAIITWSAMQYASQNGYKMFDLMGAGEPGVPYGVRDFKQQFGGRLYEFGRFRMVTHSVLYTIGCMGMKIINIRKKQR